MKIDDIIYVHIPKTGGYSMCQSLKLVKYKNWFNHSTAKEIRVNIGEEEFKKKFIYTIVRNPWDRILSSYKFIKFGTEVVGVIDIPEYKEYRQLDFDGFIDKLYSIFKLKGEVLISPNSNFYSPANKVVMNQHNFIYDDGTELVNYIGHLNNLQESLDEIFNITGVRIPQPQKTNVGKSGGENVVMSDECIDKITEMYQRDIDLFGF